MKIRNLISALCAAAMIVSSVSAFAVEPNDANRISEHAGKTATCQVVTATDDGVTSVIYEVPIPVGTTKAAEGAIVRSYILQTGEAVTAGICSVQRAGDPQPGDYDPPYYYVSYLANVPTMMPKGLLDGKVGGGKLGEWGGFKQYTSLLVEFENLIPNSSAKNLYIELKNTTQNKTLTNSIKLGYVTDYTYFYAGTAGLALNAGNEVQVYAYTDNGAATANSCSVMVYPKFD